MNPEKIAFLLDSTADLGPNDLAGKPFYVVPLRIACADGDYNDGETINNLDVYARQEAGELPKTSLPELARVEKALEQIRDDGFQKVIVLPLSSGLSGTHNMMQVMCDEFGELETAVFETRSGALGIGMVALQLWNISRRAGASVRSPLWPGHCCPSSLCWALPRMASSSMWPRPGDGSRCLRSLSSW